MATTSEQVVPTHEPHKIKTVRLASFPPLAARRAFLEEAECNAFRLRPSQIVFDMCSLGTSAMRQEQVAGAFVGDEAYAGARNFERLEAAARDALGHDRVCPTHNLLGCTKLLAAAFVSESAVIVTNHSSSAWAARGVQLVDIKARGRGEKKKHGVEKNKENESPSFTGNKKKTQENGHVFTGNLDLAQLERVLSSNSAVAFVSVEAYANGRFPVSLENVKAVRRIADAHEVRLVLDASRIVENAWTIQRHEPGSAHRDVASLVKEFARAAHVVQMDAREDPKCASGGLLATSNGEDHERFCNEVVVYEGLHTYGGMAGRTMEQFARGLEDMCDDNEVQWLVHQSARFCDRLHAAGVPIVRGCDGAYVRTDAFFSSAVNENHQDTFSAALYLYSGVRAFAPGLANDDATVPVQIPRLAMTQRHLDQVADAVIGLFQRRDAVLRGLQAVATTAPATNGETHGGDVTKKTWRDEMRYRWAAFPDFNNAAFEFDAFPFTIHTFERIGSLCRDGRQKAIEAAGYNTFLLRSADVAIDLLTDSGTSAQSSDQWAAFVGATETPGTSDEALSFQKALRDFTGYEHVIPTHQGRAAEQILSEVLITQPGQLVPGNMYFTTTKLHQELASGVFADVIVDEAHRPQSSYPWKGNIDLSKLQKLVDDGNEVAYVSFEHSVNMAGGQPVSMQNMKDVSAYCKSQNIPVLFDATRVVENAYIIQSRDAAYAKTPIRDIVREMFSYGDGCTVSGKKDFLVNIGGLLAFKDNAKWAAQALEKLRTYEGGPGDGGLSSADLAAVTRGVQEAVDDRYIRERVRQTAYLGSLLLQAGVPIVTPPGSHAVFVDAKKFLPHLDQDEYPAQRLAAAIYVETGVRAMERGNVSKGRDPNTGLNYRPALELVRLTIPRRVYSNCHMRAVADGLIRLYQDRHNIFGLKLVHEAPKLRFFQARFELLPGTSE